MLLILLTLCIHCILLCPVVGLLEPAGTGRNRLEPAVPGKGQAPRLLTARPTPGHPQPDREQQHCCSKIVRN